MLNLKFHTLATWCKELTHLKRPWCWERLKVGGEGGDRGWAGWMASPTRWTWVWVSSGCWWSTGEPGVPQSMGSQKSQTRLSNWTELSTKQKFSCGKQFILSAVDLLRLIHVAGNDSTNIFSACASIKPEGDVSNVAEGFKSHLIRLIGNLCYKNKDNQDKVRFLVCSIHIPLYLEYSI